MACLRASGRNIAVINFKKLSGRKITKSTKPPSYRPPFKHKIILKLSKNAYIAH
jgi:hypothetical protein